MFRLPGLAAAASVPGLILDRIQRRPVEDGRIDLSPRPSESLKNAVTTLAAKHRVSPEDAAFVADHVSRAMSMYRVFVSFPDEIPEFRRVAIFARTWRASEAHTAICVTEDGLLGRFELDPDIPLSVRTLSSALAKTAKGRKRPVVDQRMVDLNFNKRSNQGVTSGAGVASAIINNLFMESGGRVWQRLPDPFRMALHHVLRSRCGEAIGLARYALSSALDPELRRVMYGVSLTRSSDAEWLSGAPMQGEHFTSRTPRDALDQELRLARTQAVASFPAMARVLRDSEGFRRAIDERRPLSPMLAGLIGVPTSSVRLIQGLTWQMAGIRPSEPKHGLKMIASVPADFTPAKRSEYRQIPLIADLSHIMGMDLGEAMRWMAAGGSPYRFGERLRSTSPMDVSDAARYLIHKLIHPAKFHALRWACEKDPELLAAVTRRESRRLGGLRCLLGGTDPALTPVKEVLRGMSARAVFDFSDRWHRALPRHEDRLITLTSNETWGPLLGEIDLPGGVTARELSTSLALKEQGRSEGHCVGGYTGAILIGDERNATCIFSLEAAGTVIGTLQVYIDRKDGADAGETVSDTHSVTIAQNQSKKNSPVGADARRAASGVVKEIERLDRDKFLEYILGLKKTVHAEKAIRRLPPYIKDAGYDIWEPGAIECAWAELSVYLPKGTRKAGLDAFIEGQFSDAERQQLLDAPGASGRSADPQEPFWERDRRLIDEFRRPARSEGFPVEHPEGGRASLLPERIPEDENDNLEVPF